ncbi:MAG: hypothetical protein C0392_08190 [Syntrophus sp. (in: bacteria)]|nr:hypothetical protein [Syntrophus sp. (in: bacteria)]
MTTKLQRTFVNKGGGKIDLETLPEEARQELYIYYEFLRYKYNIDTDKAEVANIVKNIEDLSWEMGEKFYKTRAELYEG